VVVGCFQFKTRPCLRVFSAPFTDLEQMLQTEPELVRIESSAYHGTVSHDHRANGGNWSRDAAGSR
jgi:hypothetical protein